MAASFEARLQRFRRYDSGGKADGLTQRWTLGHLDDAAYDRASRVVLGERAKVEKRLAKARDALAAREVAKATVTAGATWSRRTATGSSMRRRRSGSRSCGRCVRSGASTACGCTPTAGTSYGASRPCWRRQRRWWTRPRSGWR